MSVKALPLLFLSMGGEMLYILEQRLKAQHIAPDKTIKVLHDIMGTLLHKKFIEEVFKDQQIYSRKALRMMYERLAHSSIMRLNSTSMDKLYDLMIMAVKYQTCQCKRPQDILLITLNHIDVFNKFAQGSALCTDLVNNVYQMLYKHYASLTPGEFMLIRQATMEFFQDIHIRVSIFLRDKVQNSSHGRFIYAINGQLPVGTELPGKIRLYVSSGECIKTIEFKTGAGAYTSSMKEGSYEKIGDRVTTLGTNMYNTANVLSANVSHPTSSHSGPTTYKDYDPSDADPQARAQLDLLCQLIGGGSSRVHSTDSKVEFHLNFLNDVDDDNDDGCDMSSTAASSHVSSAYNVVNIDATKVKTKHGDELARIMGDMSFESSSQTRSKNEEDDDLLHLMDSVQ